MPDTELVVFAGATNAVVSGALGGLRDRLAEAAHANVASAIEEAGQEFTVAEVHAMEVIEQLRLLNGLDFYTVLERGRLIREIEVAGLLGLHPGQYADLNQLADRLKISKSEISDTRVLCFTIFPALGEYGYDPALCWETIGKSNFRDLVPVLKGLITGEDAGRESTQGKIDLIRARAVRADSSLVDPDDIREGAIDLLMAKAMDESTTNEVLRAWLAGEDLVQVQEEQVVEVDEDGNVVETEEVATIPAERPAPVPDTRVNFFVLQLGDRRLAVAEVDEGQLALFRAARDTIDLTELELPDNANQRRRELLQYAPVRVLYEEFLR